MLLLRCHMKETGMVRRLDDLGRLVIPKEIRKMYKMKEGDSIEVYIKDGSICIRKFDETSAFFDEIVQMCDLLNKRFQNKIFFTSEEYLEKNGIKLDENMQGKVKVHTITYFENTKVFDDEDERFSGCILPVMSYGNYYGSFVVVYDARELAEADVQCIKMFADLLSSQQH